MKNKSPITDLVKALKTDKAYQETWIANIAMAFQDEYRRSHQHNGVHYISNKAAKNFIKLLLRNGKTK